MVKVKCNFYIGAGDRRARGGFADDRPLTFNGECTRCDIRTCNHAHIHTHESAYGGNMGECRELDVWQCRWPLLMVEFPNGVAGQRMFISFAVEYFENLALL